MDLFGRLLQISSAELRSFTPGEEGGGGGLGKKLIMWPGSWMGVSDKGFENLKCSKFKKQQSKYKARCIFTEYAENSFHKTILDKMSNFQLIEIN